MRSMVSSLRLINLSRLRKYVGIFNRTEIILLK